MKLQISHNICTAIYSKDILRKKKKLEIEATLRKLCKRKRVNIA